MRAWWFALLGPVALAASASGPQPAEAAKLTTILRAVLLPEEARHNEEFARRRHRPEEERYWRDYGAGLEEQRRERGIGRDEALRYQEMAHHSGRRDEERYWRDYRGGLERRGR